MTIIEAIKEWERDITVYFDYSSEMKISEYNEGFTDGLKMGLTALKAHLEECSDYPKGGGKS